ncbi:helix-turn-helix domain-containing protein [Clostridiales Family XIII bacterium ASD5510]|uniref:Helix-turn-helix domain-containing protein n=1 Tax=Hominibacterium faecale TaxID=2839743 RepID=A0A9J6QYC4_9FIRM|nr:helix-turn-helix transcriptional regulator [Hominibacterium faecale]MCU7380466.1 helix-turn-helix domain-containing protein [Hominibacterium faecale]
MNNRVISLINSSGMSDYAISKELSLGNGIIGKWRKGLQNPSTDAVIKIANYFNVSTDYLLTGKETSQVSSISQEDQEWLDLIHQLPPEKMYEFKGELKGYLRYMEESAAVKPPNKTGTDNPK